jgi:putative membrane protein
MRKVGIAFAALVALIFLPLFAAAHEGKPHRFSDLWYTWAFDPFVIAGLGISGAIYGVGLYRLWKVGHIGRAISRWQAVAFVAGWLSIVIALVSPLHPWGEVLFSAHMTQHEILMLVSAPLLVLSRPLVATVWAMPPAWRKSTGGFFKTRPVENVSHFITYPLTAWAIHLFALWIWHVPALFQATLRSDLIHTFQHVIFFGSALLFWWAIVAGPRGAVSYGAGVLYLFTTSIHSGILGAFLTFTSRVWYPSYSGSTTSWGLTPIEDQQLGGLIMWVPAGLVYIVAALIMFAGWMAESEKRVRHREAMFWSSSV